MTQEGNKIMASEGKLFRRIEDQTIYGPEIYLGYSHYIGGIKLDEPHLDLPEDFEEIDIPDDYNKIEDYNELMESFNIENNVNTSDLP